MRSLSTLAATLCLCLGAGLASPAALAQDDDSADQDEDEDSGADEILLQDEPPAARPAGPKPQWKTQPYIRPAIGAGVFQAGDETFLTAALGAKAGIHYWQQKPDPYVRGTARILGQYIIGSGSQGYQVRVGTFAGPWYKVVGLQTGPDFFYNQFTYGGFVLDASPGVSWPVIGLLDFKVVNFHAGVEPAFFFNPDRPTVDWSQEERFGFGGEFTYLAGVGLDLDAVGLSLNYTDRITAFGNDRGFGVGIRVGG